MLKYVSFFVFQTSHIEDNSESINSDASTEAQRDSGEISESNTEANSKRNSFNNDYEIENKTELSTDLNKLDYAATKSNDIEETKGTQKNNEEMESTDVGKEKNENHKAIDTETAESTIDLIAMQISIEKEMLENETEEKENAITEQNLENLVLNDDFSEGLNKIEKPNDDVKATRENLLEKGNEYFDKIIDLSEMNANERLIKGDKSNTQERYFCEDGNISKANEFATEDIQTEKDIQQADTKSSQDIKIENKNDDNRVDHEDTTSSIQKLADVIDSEKSTDQNKIEVLLSDINTAETTTSDLNFVLNYSSADEDISLAELSHNDLKLSQNKLNTPLIVLDESTADSLKSTANSTDSETRNLKNVCLTTSVKILVHRLRAEDLTFLRQPKVKLKRINVEQYAEEYQAKRRRITGRGKSKLF